MDFLIKYFSKTHFKTNRSGNERAMGSDAQKKQKIRRRKAFNYEITRKKIYREIGF